MKKLNKDIISKIDSNNMFDTICKFPQQVQDAIKIGKDFSGFPQILKNDNFYILGMGGSAIGGDLLASYFAKINGADKIRFQTIRNYDLPANVIHDSNFIVSSYSGGTEETLSAFAQTLKITNNLICITTGGKLKELAQNNSVPIISIPSGYQPRAALAYSFFPMLMTVLKTEIINNKAIIETNEAIDELVPLLQNKSIEYADYNSNDNLALNISHQLLSTIPIIYSADNSMNSVNTRWVRQIQENAKYLVFNGFLPEMNHNEINSFKNPIGFSENISLIFIRDKDDHSKIGKRFEALKSLIGKDVKNIISIQSNAKHWLTRMFDMVYLGDWVSYYLAILLEEDPTPIPIISKLKEYLKEK